MTSLTNQNEITSFKYKFDLENNVKATLIFDSLTPTESQINYHYSFTKKKSRRDIELVVEQTVHAKYSNGILSNLLNITYHIINPSNLGKKYAFGIDVSPNSKVFLDISYKLNSDGNYAIDEIHKGSSSIYSASTDDKSLLSSSVESPLDIRTIIINEHDEYNIPLALTENCTQVFMRVHKNQRN